jgi:hypothetical protein
MLKSVDILIGLSVVMLVMSLAVTLLTQVVTSLLNTRGGHLMRGLQDLLQQLDPALTKPISKEISQKVLTSPLISDVGNRLGTVVHREEFIKLLLDLSSESGPQRLEPDALAALKKAMQRNGIADPGATLENVRSFALTLEKSNPELANNVRLNAAILHEAGSQFVAKIHGWFDQTIDRVAGRFTASTRVITVVAALMVAFVVQLDAIALVNRLSTDTQLRQSLVQAAKNVGQQPPSTGSPAQPASDAAAANPTGDQPGSARNPAKKTPGPGPATTANDSTPKDAGSASNDAANPANQPGSKKDSATPSSNQGTANPAVPSRVVSDVDAILGSTGLISAPDWRSFNPQKLLGILLSTMLLSLGAPFWYDTLKSSLRLRDTIADKDDAQRLERQSTQPSPQSSSTTTGGMTSATGAVAGEQGDLALRG